MPYKTKIRIAIIVGVVAIVILMIIMIAFVSNNNTSSTNTAEPQEGTSSSNEENNSQISTTEDIISIGTQKTDEGNFLVKISDSLTSENIAELSNREYSYQDYCYSDNSVYLICENDEEIQVSCIDLSNNEENLILEFEDNYVNSFEYYDGDIYFVANGDVTYNDENYYATTQNYICRYDVSTQEKEIIVQADDVTRIVCSKIDQENNAIYYMKNTYNSETSICNTMICKLDMLTGNTEDLIQAEAEGQEMLFKNNNEYLVCKLKSGEESLHYVYNITDGSLWDLGSLSLTYEDIDSYIAFSENYIVFSDSQDIKLFDYEGNSVNSSLYSAESGSRIYDIAMISNSILQIRISDYNNVYENNITNAYLIDFNNSTIQEISENYYDIIVIN